MKPTPNDIITFDKRVEHYISYVKRLQELRFTTGMGPIDSEIRGVAPGEVMGIIAYSGTFKSAYLQNLLLGSARRTGLYPIKFSMEMPKEKCFEREMQIACGFTGHYVERLFTNVSDKTKQATDIARAEGCEKLLLVDRPRLSVQDIKKLIQMARERYEVGVVGVDYLGLMASDKTNLLDRMADLTYGLKDMAKELQLPVIFLGQVSRAYASSKSAEVGIETDAAKGGGDIEAGCDFMLGMYRYEERLIMKLLKNRNGRAGQEYLVNLEPHTLRFGSIVPWERPKQKGGKKDPYGDYPV